MTQRTVLITGANRGIGAAISARLLHQGLRVVMTARDGQAAGIAASRHRAAGLDALGEQLDVTDADSLHACAQRLNSAEVHVDVLVNNAGVYDATPLVRADEHEFALALAVNLVGPWRVARRFVPPMVRAGYGRVVNVSTGYAHVGSEAPQAGVYGLSKAALNAMTRMLAAEAGPAVKVNAMSPGWVATRMGGLGAPNTPEQAAVTAAWLATLPDDGPTDGFFHEMERIPW